MGEVVVPVDARLEQRQRLAHCIANKFAPPIAHEHTKDGPWGGQHEADG